MKRRGFLGMLAATPVLAALPKPEAKKVDTTANYGWILERRSICGENVLTGREEVLTLRPIGRHRLP